MTRLYSILAPIALIAVLLGAWEIACRALHVPAYFLPQPSAIAAAAVQNAPALLHSAWNTLSMALVALIAASAIATGLALLVAPSSLLESAVRPIAVALQVTPIVAVAPQAVIWSGLDHPERAVVGLAAIVGAVVAEFVAGSGSAQGLAWRILEAANRLQIAKEFAAVLVLGIMGVALHGLLQAGERAILLRWRGRR